MKFFLSFLYVSVILKKIAPPPPIQKLFLRPFIQILKDGY